MSRLRAIHFIAPAILLAVAISSRADEKAYAAIESLLVAHCYDCHGDGMDKGDFAMDDYASLGEHLQDFDVWYEIWKNVRSNLMPPADKPQLKSEDKAKLLAFI